MRFAIDFFSERKNAVMVGYVLTMTAFFYAALKAYFLPFTGDEASSYMDLLYMKPGYFLGNTPNTHLLNSAWMKFASMFSSHPLALRFLSVCSVLIFGWAGIQVFVEIKREVLIVPVLLFCFLNPYLIDFFSLARGYAFAMSLMVVCIYFLCKYLNERSQNYFLLSSGAAALSTISAYVMLNFYLLVLLWFFFESVNHARWKEVFANLWSWITHLVLVIVVAYVLSRFKGLSGAWPVQHFWPDAWFSLIFYGSTFGKVITGIFAWVSLFIILAATLNSLKDINSLAAFRRIFSVQGFFLVITLGIFVFHVLQHNLINAPYPSMRGFVYFYPLIVFFIVLQWRFSSLQGFYMVIIFLSILILNFVRSVGLTKSQEAPWANDTVEMVKDLKVISRGDSISLGVSGIHADPFNFYVLTQKLPWKNIGFGFDLTNEKKGFYFQSYQTGEYDYMILELEDYNRLKQIWELKTLKFYPRTGNVLIKVISVQPSVLSCKATPENFVLNLRSTRLPIRS